MPLVARITERHPTDCICRLCDLAEAMAVLDDAEEVALAPVAESPFTRRARAAQLPASAVSGDIAL